VAALPTGPHRTAIGGAHIVSPHDLLFSYIIIASIIFFSGQTFKYRVKLAFHGADTDTDTDSPNTAIVLRPTHRILARKSIVSDVMMYRRVGRVGVGVRVRVGVGVIWNASFRVG